MALCQANAVQGDIEIHKHTRDPTGTGLQDLCCQPGLENGPKNILYAKYKVAIGQCQPNRPDAEPLLLAGTRTEHIHLSRHVQPSYHKVYSLDRFLHQADSTVSSIPVGLLLLANNV